MIIVIHTGWSYDYDAVAEKWRYRVEPFTGSHISVGDDRLELTEEQLRRAWLVVLEASEGKYFVVQCRAEETPCRLLSLIEVMGLMLRSLEAESKNHSCTVKEQGESTTRAAVRIVGMLHALPEEQRQAVLSEVANEFCIHCGRRQPAGGCPCERDE